MGSCAQAWKRSLLVESGMPISWARRAGVRGGRLYFWRMRLVEVVMMSS